MSNAAAAPSPETLTRTSGLAFHGFAGWTFVAPDYFNVLKIPVVRGRDFTDRDTASAPGVVIINQEMARRFWPTGDPLNHRLIIGRGMRPAYDQEPLRQIVGIVGNVRVAFVAVWLPAQRATRLDLLTALRQE